MNVIDRAIEVEAMDWIIPILPIDWKEIPAMEPPPMQRAYRNRHLLVLIDNTKKSDGKHSVHVSFSRKDRLPNYEEITEVKRLFVGKNNKAIMVFPEEKNHVNINPYCLHLWCCVDGDGLPEFSSHIPGIGRSI